MKLGTLVNSKESLIKFSKQNLPIEISWELSKLLTKVLPEITSFETLKNNKIISYGETLKDKDGKDTDQVKVKPENEEIFRNEIIELLDKDIELEIPVIEMKDIIEYNKKLEKKIDMQVEDILILNWLLK